MHTIDPKMLMAWADVLAFGAQKYHQRNFLKAPGMAWSRVYDSLNRHLWAFWDGEWLDPESGLPHLAHVMCNLQFLWTYHENGSYHVGDDRPSSIEYEGAQYNEWEARFKDVSAGIPNPMPPTSSVPDIFGGLRSSPGKSREFIDSVLRRHRDAPSEPGHYGSMRGKTCMVIASTGPTFHLLVNCEERNIVDTIKDEVKRGNARLVEERPGQFVHLKGNEAIALHAQQIPLKEK